MRWQIQLLILLALFLSGQAFGEDFDFEIPAEEDAPAIEFSGNLDAKWGVLRMRELSPFFRLNFLDEPEADTNLSQYRLDFYLDGEYRYKEAGFFLKTFTQAIPEGHVEHALFELYGTLSLSPRLRLGIGKHRYNWGKGYAFNPVGYVNTQKDPENPDLALAGKPSVFLSYNRSLQNRWLSNVSLTGVLLHPDASFNERLASIEDVGVALKFYMLLRDIDLEAMMFHQEDQPRRFGLDFATNLRSNLELHGEFSFAQDETRLVIQGDEARVIEDSGLTYLVGARYLTASNTTFIMDYYHQDAGLSSDEFEAYLHMLEGRLAVRNSEQIAASRMMLNTVFPSGTFMRDYLYVKVNQPEPFSWLYASVSAFSIVSLSDGSFSLSPQLSYKRFTNTELLLWPTVFVGGADSEYGSKQAQWKVEVWLRFHF